MSDIVLYMYRNTLDIVSILANMSDIVLYMYPNTLDIVCILAKCLI